MKLGDVEVRSWCLQFYCSFWDTLPLRQYLFKGRGHAVYVSYITVAAMNTTTKSKLGRKAFTGLTLPYHSSSLKAVKTGTQTGPEPRGRSWHWRSGGVLLTGLLFMAFFQSAFLYHRGLPVRHVRTHSGLGRLASITKKKPFTLPTVWHYGGISSSKFPSFQMTLA